MPSFDYILVGGGLQNGLIALALLERDPEASLVLIERDSSLGGNHTWCFHAEDVPQTARVFVEPLVCHRWSGYSVAFPNHTRHLDAPYACATSSRFHQVVSERVASAPRAELLLDTPVTELGRHEVVVGDGRHLEARVVIDSRGPTDDMPSAAFQKFVGLEVELADAHQLQHPWLMDATVPQTDGFRFFYTLPLSPTRLLIEDTYFADSPDLDLDAIAAEVHAYADSRGYCVAEVVRREHGVLPLPWEGDPEPPSSSPLVAGYRGGWFHPATGYSFPVAVRLADTVASVPPDQLFGPELQALAEHQKRQIRYCHKLNKMLFRWFHPDQRWNVFERFYKLPEPLIRRFYALDMSALDRARILVGKPPRGLSIRAGLARRSLL